MNELFSTIALLGALQGGALSLRLWLRSQNVLASKLLGSLVGGVASMLLLGYVGQRWGWDNPHWLGLGAPLTFLFAPLLYLYVLALTRPLERLRPIDLVHALPFLAFLAYMCGAFYFQGAEAKLQLAKAHVAGHITPGSALFNGVRIAQAMAYLSLSYRALLAHRSRMEGYYSELHGIDLRWLSTIVLCNALIWSLVAAQDLAEALSWGVSFHALDRAVEVGSALFVFLIGYIFLWQPDLTEQAKAGRRIEEGVARAVASAVEVLDDAASTEDHHDRAPEDASGSPSESVNVAPALDPAQRDDSAKAPRYQRNRLDDDESERLATALQQLMQHKEPFRDALLTAQALADELGISPHTLSQVLNVRIGQTFYAFVNQHRVDALKESLRDPRQGDRGVLELALEAGFNSKSTLNSFFKKYTGTTPTQFRRHARTA